jgi:hypothetical protein
MDKFTLERLFESLMTLARELLVPLMKPCLGMTGSSVLALLSLRLKRLRTLRLALTIFAFTPLTRLLLLALTWSVDAFCRGEDEDAWLDRGILECRLLGVPRPRGLSMLMVWAVSEVLSLEGPWVPAVSCVREVRGSAGEVDLRSLAREAESRWLRGFAAFSGASVSVLKFSAAGATTGSEGGLAGWEVVATGWEVVATGSESASAGS